ncbi:uncharacterized protein LOC115377538 [Myripristis murdjan]|uniref:uncharacterized protein LOC115377538 n=1 Tax=Myripristis murdjan TaxID=586833 RepID=UPI001175E76C|nr:uncharacterized protein LOC115377538 [Myripristis murdjan]
MAIALVSLAKHTVRSAFSWDRLDLDRALVEGDELYTSLRDLNIFSHVSNLLSVPDLPQQLELDGELFRFSFGDTVLGEVGVTEGEYIDFGVFISLRNGLERIFSQYTTCLLTMCGNTTAIVREGGRFAVVDSHSRSSTGLLHHNGTSVVLHFTCLDDLHHYICRLADSLRSREKLFELCGVTVSTGASPARSGVSVESLVTGMSAAPAPESSVLTEAGRKSEVSAGVCVPECGVSIAASPALSGISVFSFSSEVSSGSAAEPTVTDGRKRVISSGTCMSKKSKSFDVREVNSDIEFVSEVSPVATEEGLLGVPCSKERIVTDGNCFFRAISQAVSGSQKHHQYIEQSRMRRVGSWATEVEIQATADWDSIEHRESVKARSVGKYRDSIEHRESVKAKVLGKYRDSIQYRESVKARSFVKYRDSVEHRERKKAKKVVRYRDSIEHRERVKAKSLGKYRDSVEYRAKHIERDAPCQVPPAGPGPEAEDGAAAAMDPPAACPRVRRS